MGQITGAIIGITLVLIAVFIPMAFFGGSVGKIYRQFSLSLVVVDGVLGADGADADPGAVRHAAQAGRGRPSRGASRASSAGSTAPSPAATDGYQGARRRAS